MSKEQAIALLDGAVRRCGDITATLPPGSEANQNYSKAEAVLADLVCKLLLQDLTEEQEAFLAREGTYRFLLTHVPIDI